jgi:hypothetical protein
MVKLIDLLLHNNSTLPPKSMMPDDMFNFYATLQWLVKQLHVRLRSYT